MDLNKIVSRAKAMITAPRSEWPIAAAEPDTVNGLFTNYIVLLAAIPPIANFLKTSLIGTSIAPWRSSSPSWASPTGSPGWPSRART